METEKRKLTDNQLRLVQAIAGALCAAALMVSIMIASMPFSKGNLLLEYLFVIVFVIITIGRRRIETRFRLRLNLFNLVMIVGIMIGIYIYVVNLFYNPEAGVKLGDTEKVLILVGILLAILALGFGLPFWRYSKRKAKGTLAPIRIPEKTEEEQKEEERRNVSRGGHSSVAQQIAEMQRELEEKDREGK
jgi:hypothetical protein